MKYRGRVRDGKLILDSPIELPDGTRVHIEVIREKDLQAIHHDVAKVSGIIPSNIDTNQAKQAYLLSRYNLG